MYEKYDKKHWYDGWFYAKFIDPWVSEVRGAICDFIEADSYVIDIGSGTGALAFRIENELVDRIGKYKVVRVSF